TWLYTIALRVAHDHHRGRQARARNLRLERVDCHTLPDRDHGPTLGDRDNVWHIARRLLKDTQYTALWLRYGEELSVGEIAQVMAKTQVGIRVLLHRARTKLLHELTRHGSLANRGPWPPARGEP
ncbi:MAG TPA: sigma-70 family RNA polymerase sigma factor, partial [Pirellulaceae bacterium]